MSLRGVASHEIGHCLESYILYKRKKENRKSYNKYAWVKSVVAEKITRQAYSNLQTSQPLNELRMQISKYSTTNYAETIAEAVNDYLTNRDKAAQLSKEIVKIIKEEIK